MKARLALISVLAPALFLILVPNSVASTIWYVDGVNGNDGNDCKSSTTACKTIGHAISLASSGDSIMVAAATYAENLTISFSLKLIGSGANTTIIDGGTLDTVVTVYFGTNVLLSKLTVRNGSAGGGGGISNGGTLTINDSIVSGNVATSSPRYWCSGGGIFNSGVLTINNSTISSNRAGRGGGICNLDNAVTINGSTLNGNTAFTTGCASAYGGGIESIRGSLTINDSTITGNLAMSTIGPNCLPPAYGGGISNPEGTNLTINNGTLDSNSVVSSGGGVFGGGIFGIATLQNSIVANNTGGGNCSSTLTSLGYNLSSDTSCNFNNVGDLNNTDPKLGPLQNNGGPTQTQALLSGSPAIDAGNPSGCTDGNGHLLKTDQRGAPRPDKEDTSGCDMGAYESQTD